MRNNIRSTAAALVIGTALSTSVAHSADLDPVMEAYDWSGSYFGIKLGGAVGTSRMYDPNFSPSGSTNNLSGFVGGIMSGYNIQMQTFVFGIDSDLSFADIDGPLGRDIFPTLGGFNNQPKTEIESLSTTRLRIGFAMDRIMPYVTGGLATAYVDYKEKNAPTGVTVNGKSELHLGFAVGGGVEWAFADGWHARVEGLYVDLSEKSHNAGGFATRINPRGIGVFRVGVAMKTGWIWDSIMGAR